MSDHTKRNLEVLSSIDEGIVEWSGKKRVALKQQSRKRAKKKWYIMGGSMAAAAALVLGVILLLVSLLSGQTPTPIDPTPGVTKQVPVYQGMTVSNTLSGDAVVQYNGSNGNGNNDNGNHYGHYTGDYKHDQQLPEGEPFPDKPLSGSLTVLGSDDGYYAKPGEDIYITVHLSNPDKFEILSFTLNGEKYSSYMFEDGSDLENLILKVNVGQVEGMISYTIDAIKYVDGEEIKDVRMDGDQTVEIGVYTEKQPTVTVSSVTVGFHSVVFAVSGTDEMSLIAASNGKVEALLYNGDKIVARKEISLLQGATVSFDDLAPNTLYQYAIVADYDALDGKGYSSYILEEQAFYTEAPVLFDEVTLTTTGIDFALDWHAEANGAVQSIVLSDGTSERVLDTSATAVTDLLPATDYTLTLTYKNGDRTETISLEFTTAPLTYTVNHLMEQLDGTYQVVETFTDLIALGESVTPAVQTHEGFTSPAEITITGQTGGVLEVNYKYERTTYTLTFVRNDGTEPDTLQMKYGHEIPGDIREGFGGWFRDETLTEAVYTVPAEDVTLYAKWEDVTSAEFLTYTGLETLTVTGLKDGVTLTELSIPSYIGGKRVTAIAEQAFYNESSLAAVTVPETVEAIGLSAFGGCAGLAELTVPFVGEAADGTGSTFFGHFFGGLTVDTNYLSAPNALRTVTVTGNVPIADNAFMGCLRISTVNLGANVPAIGANAFSGCTGISNLNIAGCTALTTIGENAFSGCTGLASLTIPENVTTIGASAFEGLTNLATINFNAIAMGDLVNDTFSAAGSAGEGIAVTFGANVTKVPKKLFAHFNAEGKSSPNIKSVSFAAGSVCKEICMDTFSNCATLSSVTLPDGLEKINTGAFYNNDALTAITVPASVTEISGSVFGNCALLETVSFGTGSQLKTLGAAVFSMCPMLKTVNLPDALTSMGNGVFYNCTSLSSIVIPMDVTSLGTSAFKGCTALETVEIKGNIGTLGEQSFDGCTALTTALLSGEVTAIGKQAFSGCTLLSEVTLPEGLLTIGQESFIRCSALTEITLPETLTEIGVGCFVQSGLTSIRIPASVTTLGASNFSGCNSLESVIFAGEQITTLPASAFQGCSKLAAVEIPNGVAAINGGAFNNCIALKSVKLPASVTTIGQNAFRGCTALKRVDYTGTLNTWMDISFGNVDANPIAALGELFVDDENIIPAVLTIPAERTEIKAYTFYGCTGITELNVHAGVTSVGTGAFGGVALKKAVIPTFAIGKFVNTDLEYLEINGGTEIAESAFANCTKLTEVVIGDTVTSIGEKVFEGCTAMESIVIPFDEGHFKTMFDTFPETLKTLEITGGQFMGGWGGLPITTLKIPASVKSFGDWAFLGCTSLTRVEYAGTLRDWCNIHFGIEDETGNPCYYSHNLYIDGVNVATGSLVIPDGVTNFDYAAFAGWPIDEIVIPATVTQINSLTGVVLSVDRIVFAEDFAGSCNSYDLEHLGMNEIVFGDSMVAELYSFVADRSVEAYYWGSADDWAETGYEWPPYTYSTLYCYSETEPTTEGNYWHYVDGVVTVW